MHKIAQKIPLLLAEVIKGHLWWCWGPQMPQSWRKQMGSTNFFWVVVLPHVKFWILEQSVQWYVGRPCVSWAGKHGGRRGPNKRRKRRLRLHTDVF